MSRFRSSYLHLATLLDRWLAVRWRALLTWVVLSGLMAAVQGHWWLDHIDTAISGLTRFVNRVSPVPLPAFLEGVAYLVNLSVLYYWFEPLLLRLSLARGAMWLGLRIGAMFMWAFVFPASGEWSPAAFSLLLSIAFVPVLWGWRTRPWMAVVGDALSLAISEGLKPDPDSTPTWLWNPVVAIPFAAALLYGTRLLSAEERNRRVERTL